MGYWNFKANIGHARKWSASCQPYWLVLLIPYRKKTCQSRFFSCRLSQRMDNDLFFLDSSQEIILSNYSSIVCKGRSLYEGRTKILNGIKEHLSKNLFDFSLLIFPGRNTTVLLLPTLIIRKELRKWEEKTKKQIVTVSQRSFNIQQAIFQVDCPP